MDFTIVSDLFADIDQAATDFALENIGNLLAVAAPIVGLALVISLMIQGTFMMISPTGEPLSHLVGRFIKYAMVVGVVGTGGLYQSDIASMVLNLPDELANEIYIDGSTQSAGTMGAVIDDAITEGAKLAKESFDNVGVWGDGLVSLFIGGHILVCTFLFAGVGAALILMAKILLAVTIAFGPIFICCLMFDSTKHMFSPWAGSAVNYVLMAVIVSAIFSLMTTYYTNVIVNSADPSQDVSLIYTVLSTGFLLVVTVMVLWKVPSLCAAWSSGISASYDGALGALSRASSGGGSKGGKSGGGSGSGSGSGAGSGAGASGASSAASAAGGVAGQAAGAALRFARK